MREIYNLYEKPKNPLNYVAVRVSLASPEKIRSWSHGEVKSQKPSTTVPLSRSAMACFVPKFLGLSRTTNVCVVNTNVLNTAVLFVKNAALR